MYYVLLAWVIVSAVALVTKLAKWRDYAQTSPFAKPAARRAERRCSYVVWLFSAVLFVDRAVMGFVSVVQGAVRPTPTPRTSSAPWCHGGQGGRHSARHAHHHRACGSSAPSSRFPRAAAGVPAPAADRPSGQRLVLPSGRGLRICPGVLGRGPRHAHDGAVTHHLLRRVRGAVRLRYEHERDPRRLVTFVAGLATIFAELHRVHDGGPARRHRGCRPRPDGGGALARPLAVAGHEQGSCSRRASRTPSRCSPTSFVIKADSLGALGHRRVRPHVRHDHCRRHLLPPARTYIAAAVCYLILTMIASEAPLHARPPGRPRPWGRRCRRLRSRSPRARQQREPDHQDRNRVRTDPAQGGM